MRAGSESALVQRHQESDRAGARIIALCGGLHALAFDEPRDVPVEIEFRPVDLEVHGVRDALGKYLLGNPCAVRAALGEVDHRLLRASQIEGRAAAIHSFMNGFYVCVCVFVEELQKEAEVVGVALVWRGGEKEIVVSRVPEQFAERVTRGLAGRRGPGHAVGLVHDDQVPMNLPQSRQDLRPFGKVQGCDDLVLFYPLVDAELVANVTTFKDQELLVELLFQLALPLE